MEEGKFLKNHQQPAKTTLCDDEGGQSNLEKLSSCDQHMKPIDSPPTNGPMPNGLNIHDTIQTLFKSNPLGQSSNNAPTPNFAPKVSGNSKKSPATDLYVPVANVVRIMRKGLPPNAKVSDDAKEKVQECVSEFISFITSEANETCQIERRKTVTADDIIGAMAKLGFDNYVEPLKQYLHKYRQSEMPPPSHPKRVVGNMGSEVGPVNITPMTVLPPYAGNPVIQPQTAMFNPTATNSGSYGYGSGTSAGQIVGNPNIQDGSGPSSAIVIGDGSSGDESGDPSGSSQELNFYNLYGPYK